MKLSYGVNTDFQDNKCTYLTDRWIFCWYNIYWIIWRRLTLRLGYSFILVLNRRSKVKYTITLENRSVCIWVDLCPISSSFKTQSSILLRKCHNPVKKYRLFDGKVANNTWHNQIRWLVYHKINCLNQDILILFKAEYYNTKPAPCFSLFILSFSTQSSSIYLYTFNRNKP